MTAHMYGSAGGFDHYGDSVPIPSSEKDLIGRAELEELQARLTKELATHRASSTRMGDGYKNPVREGYDRGLTHALDEIDRILNAGIVDRIIKEHRV